MSILNKLSYFLNKCWSEETCYHGYWKEDNKASGQCAVTSLIVSEYLGGKIYKCKVNDINHYFNKIDGNILDLTKEQFKEYKIEYLDIEIITREELLKNNDTNMRYLLLKKCLEEKFKELDNINKEISSCYSCVNKVEKFDNFDTLYIGKNTDILLLGEAPANNGWRKSKMLWRNIDGKVLPSGIVLQRLLDILNINLFDLSFTEAVKCFPKDRKDLKICNDNCKEFLYRQIKLMEPKIIISLGDHATRNILDIKYKNFSKVVGKSFKTNVKGKDFIVIPIYHPSPISPKSYKDNVSIFLKIKDYL